jgi:hypothetical protein
MTPREWRQRLNVSLSGTLPLICLLRKAVQSFQKHQLLAYHAAECRFEIGFEVIGFNAGDGQVGVVYLAKGTFIMERAATRLS